MAELLKKKKTEDHGNHEGQFKNLSLTARSVANLMKNPEKTLIILSWKSIFSRVSHSCLWCKKNVTSSQQRIPLNYLSVNTYPIKFVSNYYRDALSGHTCTCIWILCLGHAFSLILWFVKCKVFFFNSLGISHCSLGLAV